MRTDRWQEYNHQGVKDPHTDVPAKVVANVDRFVQIANQRGIKGSQAAESAATLNTFASNWIHVLGQKNAGRLEEAARLLEIKRGPY